jgi:hypothetical protein
VITPKNNDNEIDFAQKFAEIKNDLNNGVPLDPIELIERMKQENLA